MDPIDLFTRSLQEATGLVMIIDERHLNNPTPCSEWDVRTLLGHMLYELAWVPDMVNGKTIAEVGDRFDHDLTEGDYKKRWKLSAQKAIDVVKTADLTKPAHLSYGDVPADDYVKEVSGDLLVHAWDLGQGLQCTLVMDKDLAKAIYDNTLPKKDTLTAGGLFGPPVPVPNNADTQTKLLGLMGRRAKSV